MIRDLKRLLDRHDNSSKPSSAQEIGKKKRQKQAKSNRKSGGQKGHTGKTREVTPTQFHTHTLSACTNCHSSEHLVVTKSTTRTITETPKVKSVTTQYTIQEFECTECGAKDMAPDTVVETIPAEPTPDMPAVEPAVQPTPDMPAVETIPAEPTPDMPAVETIPAEPTQTCRPWSLPWSRPQICLLWETIPAEPTPDMPAVQPAVEPTPDMPAVETIPAEPTPDMPAVQPACPAHSGRPPGRKRGVRRAAGRAAGLPRTPPVPTTPKHPCHGTIPCNPGLCKPRPCAGTPPETQRT